MEKLRPTQDAALPKAHGLAYGPTTAGRQSLQSAGDEDATPRTCGNYSKEERESKYSHTSQVDHLPEAFRRLASNSSIILERKRISVNLG